MRGSSGKVERSTRVAEGLRQSMKAITSEPTPLPDLAELELDARHASSSCHCHHLEREAPTWGEVGLLTDEQVRAGDAGATRCAGSLSPANIDHVERQVGELGRKGRRRVVAAIRSGSGRDRESASRVVDRGEVDQPPRGSRYAGSPVSTPTMRSSGSAWAHQGLASSRV